MVNNIISKRKAIIIVDSVSRRLTLTEELRGIGVDHGEVSVMLTNDKKNNNRKNKVNSMYIMPTMNETNSLRVVYGGRDEIRILCMRSAYYSHAPLSSLDHSGVAFPKTERIRYIEMNEEPKPCVHLGSVMKSLFSYYTLGKRNGICPTVLERGATKF